MPEKILENYLFDTLLGQNTHTATQLEIDNIEIIAEIFTFTLCRERNDTVILTLNFPSGTRKFSGTYGYLNSQLTGGLENNLQLEMTEIGGEGDNPSIIKILGIDY